MSHLSSENLTFKQRGGWWVVGQFSLLLIIMIIQGPGFPPERFSGKVCHWVGGAIIAASFLTLIWGVISLKKALTPYPYPLTETGLVREGIYAFIRHPLYFGLILGGIGIAVWRMNILAIGFSFLLGIFLNAKANREENWLIQKFPEYDDYRKTTKKIIPFIY